jgi:hypothetical protein
MTRYKICHLRQHICNHKNKISTFFFYLGKPKIKLLDILTQGFLDTGKGVYKPISKTLDLYFLYVMHLSQILLTSHFILSQ